MYISCVIKGVKQIICSYSNTTRYEMKPWALFSPRADNIAIKGISSEERRVGLEETPRRLLLYAVFRSGVNVFLIRVYFKEF